MGPESGFNGHNIHPGYAKNKMINAAALASRFITALPEWESPEHTEGREGFYHVTQITGDENYGHGQIDHSGFRSSRK